MKQIFFLTALGIYTSICLLALYFYEERTIFLDIAYHLFCITKDGTFAIQNKRFGAIATQVFPLISTQLSLPLTTVMKWYSAGFIIYYFTIFILSYYCFNNIWLAAIVLMLNTLFVTDTFYWMQSELPQGLAMLILLFALLKHANTVKHQKWWVIVIIIISVTVAFFHPLIIFPFTFFCLFFLLNKHLDYSIKWILVSASIYFISVFIKSTVLKSPYDSSAFGALKNFILLFPDYFTIPANKIFVKKLITHYYFIAISVIVISGYLAFKRDYKNLLLFVAYFIGYLLLINVSYYQGDATTFYMENLYLPLSLIIALPFSFFILKQLPLKYACVIIAFIGIIAIVRIFNNHQLYTERLSYLNEIYEKYKNEKVIIADKQFDQKKLLMSWGTPYELWLLSTVKNNQTASIVLHCNPDEIKWATENSKAFLTTWGLFDYSNMPKKYFVLPDTVSTYRIIYKQ